MTFRARKALRKLANDCVVKILKVDLETGLQEVLFIDKGENSPKPLLDSWVKSFIDNELIHPDYVECFQKMFCLEYFRKFFKLRNSFCYKYKRSVYKGGEYKWAIAFAIKEGEESAYIYICDIDDE